MSDNSRRPDEDFGANQWFIDELYANYLQDRTAVQPQWRELFRRWEREGRKASVPAQPSPESQASESAPKETAPKASASARKAQQEPDNRKSASDQSQVRSDLPPAPPVVATPATTPYAETYDLAPADDEGADSTMKLRGAAARTVTNMESSLGIPVATSVRAVPAKVLFENRAVINTHLKNSRGGKVSFTHLIGYAMVEALVEVPDMNKAYSQTEDGKPAVHEPAHVNFGLAIDLPKPDGSRTLVVPSVKAAETMDFVQFWSAYEELVSKARDNKLGVEDFQGTTATLTNPGGIGTVHSIPRLMNGQGTIVGVGAMTYPAEFAGSSDRALARLAVSRVVTLTSTYDHRIIQGAASGEFLRALEEKLTGRDGFYDRVFTALHVPYEPVRWQKDIEYDAKREMGKPARIAELIHAYRSRGHLIADTDPLAYRNRRHPDLDITRYGLTLWDLDRSFPTGGFAGTSHLLLREIIDQLRESYCRNVGIEYMHIQDPAQREWFQARLERPHTELTSEDRLQILKKLNEAEAFETFLQTKYVGQKRFSLEGGESLIPLLDAILDSAADSGLEEVAIAMAHRGRLNVLTNIAGKSYRQVFTEFDGTQDPRSVQGTGDVKYHLGTEGTYTARSGSTTEVYLAANPSHLEAADGVLEGVVRAKQDRIDLGEEGFSVLPILIHGDAAFSGQGVVTETLNYSQLRGYRTGGTVHIIVNNQIGFTTSPASGRSSYYPTDIAKGLQLPIFHVNGDDPEAVTEVARLAYEYRETFNKDVIIDMVCYRKRGHNEGDDPSMTQPVMYGLIESKRTPRQLYTESLLGRGALTDAQVEELETDFHNILSAAFDEVRESEKETGYGYPHVDTVAGLELPTSQQEDAGTIVGWTSATSPEIIARIGEAHVRAPEGFTVHPKIEQLFERRNKMAYEGGIDWGFAELIAFGSLLIEQTPVRMSGQDSRRGTFVQRHATAHDLTTGAEWTPLRHLTEDQAKLWIYDSSLSEFAVLGFEYGYSVERPDALVLWEAQFGDFANGAQTIIDEFVSSAEQKWNQRSSLVMLLPHGYEGQGPDHSSARIERFLQLCADDNMIVIQPSTPANYFHALRTQAYSRPRKPLIVMTPKQLLRRKAAKSGIEDFTAGGFKPVIGEVDQNLNPNAVNRVIMCSGRIYYDLAEQREKRGDTQTAIIRVEQFYPAPTEEIKEAIAPYGDAELVWLQDEPANQGGWPFLALNVFPEVGPVRLISRPAAASPATGLSVRHVAEAKELMDKAFTR
ncbi:multifunctional oxoglutarate decarboxylase/oxoglutarate dehydrogenase thiamine pyrophosphate-binding subunit/dihydrolipoyllysine-residue succinyltransferase subunit [Flaviflexus sp.]|uniref:multifunctional oxoglutarate decarboxylase/oxoglutarate dehydrogenase thiamine pyrophosphate-binding subunit/dihydrolipoyllysine-residue succinyltransferase subunit n=1 Tax=Flaviflexus sp. TaxID=1969482 RepID=UPI003F906001